MEPNRFFPIDALKAFAMLIVIMGHIPLYCFYQGDYEHAKSLSYLMGSINLFHMPLFVFISGYLTNIDNLRLLRKLRVLIPFFIIGLIYAFVFHKRGGR